MSLRGQDVCLQNSKHEAGQNRAPKPTNVEQDCALFLLLDNVVFEDLVVQGLWWFHGRRHDGCGGSGRTGD
jgi:hypothetical protein